MGQLAWWQVLLCLVGPFGCYALGLAVCGTYAGMRRLMPVPDPFYTFGLMYAGHCLLDPVYVAVVEALSGHWASNEYALLFSYWSALGSPYVALLLLVPMALLMAATAALVLLVYMTTVHHQPAIRDLFLRVHSSEGRAVPALRPRGQPPPRAQRPQGERRVARHTRWTPPHHGQPVPPHPPRRRR